MDEDILKLLILDYEKALAAVDKFDGQLFTIRNWAITTVGAILAVGLSAQRWPVIAAGMVPVLLFWFLELTYKCLHEDAKAKSRCVEELLQKVLSSEELPAPLSEHAFGLGKAFKKPSLRMMWWVTWNLKHIAAFYIGLIVFVVLGILVCVVR